MDNNDYGLGQLELANKRTRDFRGMSVPGRDTGIRAIGASGQQIGASTGAYTRALQTAPAAGTIVDVPPERRVAPPTLTPVSQIGKPLAVQDAPDVAAAGQSMATMIDPTTGTPIETSATGAPAVPAWMSKGFSRYTAPFQAQAGNEQTPITVPQYASDADERGSYEPVQIGGEHGAPAPEFAGYAQGGKIGERRNYTAQDLAQMGGAAPAGGMTTEQANAYYGGMNRLQRANELQNRDEGQRQANLSARSIGDRIAAENATWGAKVDASSIVGGKAARAKSALSADVARNARGVANASQAAIDAAQGPNYVGQAAAMNAQELQGRREYTAEQQAQQSLATGRQAQELGGISIEQHKTQQRLLANIEKAKTAEDRQAAISAYYASVQKEPPKPEPIVHGAAEYTKPGEVAPTKEAYFATRDSTGKVQIIKAGETAAVPSPNHIAALKADPKKMTEYFDQIYGKGAAARILEAK